VRVNLGRSLSVAATERWYTNLRAGRCFFRGDIIAAGGAGNFSEWQLFNPAASPINVIVKRLRVRIPASGNYSIRTFNTQLGTALGTGYNLLSGGAVSTGLIRSAIPAAIDGTEVGEYYMRADVMETMIDDWWFELGAGEGVLLCWLSANVANQVIAEWMEEA
jgi:hypothetical protein